MKLNPFYRILTVRSIIDVFSQENEFVLFKKPNVGDQRQGLHQFQSSSCLIISGILHLTQRKHSYNVHNVGNICSVFGTALIYIQICYAGIDQWNLNFPLFLLLSVRTFHIRLPYIWFQIYKAKWHCNFQQCFSWVTIPFMPITGYFPPLIHVVKVLRTQDTVWLKWIAAWIN